MDMIKIPEIYRELPNTEDNKYRLREFVDILLSDTASEFDSGNVWAILELLLSKQIDASYLKDTIDLIARIDASASELKQTLIDTVERNNKENN